MPRTGKKAPPKDKYGLHKQENRGAPSVLTQEITAQIEEMAKSGAINKEIIERLGISENTWYTWLSRNTNSLSEKLGDWRRQFLLAESEQALTSLTRSKNERIKLEAVKFAAERLGKKWYATREEHKVLEDNEGTELEPENKAKIDKLLGKTSAAPSESAPILSPIQHTEEAPE